MFRSVYPGSHDGTDDICTSRPDDRDCLFHDLNDLIHIRHGADTQLILEAVVVETCAARHDADTFCLKRLQILERF